MSLHTVLAKNRIQQLS